jgi:plastocyanin
MRIPRSVALTVAVAALVAAGCGSSSSKSSSSNPTAAGSIPATTAVSNTVLLKNIAFTPDTLSVKTGDRVTWVWKDGAIPHNVDGKSSLADLFSGSPQTSGTYQYTFITSGTYHITCDIHPTMKLTITVS